MRYRLEDGAWRLTATDSRLNIGEGCASYDEEEKFHDQALRVWAPGAFFYDQSLFSHPELLPKDTAAAARVAREADPDVPCRTSGIWVTVRLPTGPLVLWMEQADSGDMVPTPTMLWEAGGRLVLLPSLPPERCSTANAGTGTEISARGNYLLVGRSDGHWLYDTASKRLIAHLDVHDRVNFWLHDDTRGRSE